MAKMLLWSLYVSLLAVGGAVVRYRPQQVHLSANSNDEMTVVWSTVEDPKDTRVLFGTTRNFTREVTGVRQKFVTGPFTNRSQFIHRVTLRWLQPDTKYYYIAGSQIYGYSDLFSFTTWPLGESWSPTLAVYGDMGNRNAQSLPRIQVDTDKGMYHAILHVGDFAYDMNTVRKILNICDQPSQNGIMSAGMNEDEGRVGDEFMRQIEPVAATLPYMTCPGNHEAPFNFSNYRNRFWMPGDETKRMYYSFTMGPIRFISLNTEAIFNMPLYGYESVVQQYKWLENELENANLPENRAKQPWVITFGHRPMYCSNLIGKLCMFLANPIRVGLPLFDIPGWENLFYEYGVDVAIWAHEHSYERMWPVYDTKVMNGSMENPYTNPKATVHVVTGSAGCQEGKTIFSGSYADWSAVHSSDYGYSRLKVINSTHLYIEQVSDDKGGEIIDEFMIIKDKHGSFRQ